MVPEAAPNSRQLFVSLREPVQAQGEADALLRRLEDDEGRGLGRFQLIEQLRNGQTSTFIIFQTPEEGIGFPMSLKGFGESFDKLP